MPQFQLKTTFDQASAISDGLDAYVRLCLGQLEEVTNLVRTGAIPMAGSSQGDRVVASADVCDEIEELMMKAKALLGYSRSSNNGVGHRHVSLGAHRCYEAKKVIDQTVAMHRNPNPNFSSVQYDGLLVRYTQDPAPIADSIHHAN